jgi:hypothetical protein
VFGEVKWKVKRMENERKLQRKSKSGRRGELSREELLLISDDIFVLKTIVKCCEIELVRDATIS